MSARHVPEFLDWLNQDSETSEASFWPIYAARATGQDRNRLQEAGSGSQKKGRKVGARHLRVWPGHTFITTSLWESTPRLRRALVLAALPAKSKSVS